MSSSLTRPLASAGRALHARQVAVAGSGGRALDERSVDLVLGLFSRLRAERPAMSLITVTHDIRVADTAERIIWLRDGRVDHAHGAPAAR